MQLWDSSRYQLVASRLFDKYRDNQLENVEDIHKGDSLQSQWFDTLLNTLSTKSVIWYFVKYTVWNYFLSLSDKKYETFCFLHFLELLNFLAWLHMCNIWYIPAQTAIYWLPRSGELQTQKLKSHLVRTKSLKILPLKPGVSQDIAIHDTLAARDFLLAYFYHSGLYTCIFSKTSLNFSCVGCG